MTNFILTHHDLVLGLTIGILLVSLGYFFLFFEDRTNVRYLLTCSLTLFVGLSGMWALGSSTPKNAPTTVQEKAESLVADHADEYIGKLGEALGVPDFDLDHMLDRLY